MYSLKPLSHTNKADHKNEQSSTLSKHRKVLAGLHFAGSYTQLTDDKHDVHSWSKKCFPTTAGGHGSVACTSGLMYLDSSEPQAGVLV